MPVQNDSVERAQTVKEHSVPPSTWRGWTELGQAMNSLPTPGSRNQDGLRMLWTANLSPVFPHYLVSNGRSFPAELKSLWSHMMIRRTGLADLVASWVSTPTSFQQAEALATAAPPGAHRQSKLPHTLHPQPWRVATITKELPAETGFWDTNSSNTIHCIKRRT